MSINKKLEVPIPGIYRPKVPFGFGYGTIGKINPIYIQPHDGTKALELMEDYLLGLIKDEEGLLIANNKGYTNGWTKIVYGRVIEIL